MFWQKRGVVYRGLPLLEDDAHGHTEPFREASIDSKHEIAEIYYAEKRSILTFTMLDLSGSWLGTYWQLARPMRFEMVIIQAGSRLDGHILDDCHLGEATLVGEVFANSLQFTKRYVTAHKSPILYFGETQAEGQVLSGNWRILAKGKILLGGSGTWEARRSGSNLTLDEKASTNKNYLLSSVPDLKF